VLVRQLPADAALWRNIDPQAAVWGPSEQLLAAAVDALNVANWQRQSIHSKRRSAPPEPIARPGVKPQPGTTRLGGRAVSAEEFERMRAGHAS
jgi:hypothetical protein